MRGMRGVRAVLAGGLLALGSLATAGAAQAPGLMVLRAMQPGQWSIRERSATVEARTQCVGDASPLLQLRHAGAQCSRFVIEDQPGRATVHYTCPGAGFGRTTLTLETPRVLLVETQGVADGLPFQAEYQARRVGACTGSGSASRR